MLTVYVLVQSAALTWVGRRRPLATRPRGQAGQATAEYALVLLGVAAVALVVGTWASRTNRIGRLFDAVMDSLLSQVR